MSTQPQIRANRLNAQKSTGPRTPQGKALVSQNALRHGLSARRDVIIAESQEEFDLHRDALLAELAPEGPMESILTDRIVSLSWRLKRADLIQNQTFDAMNEKNTSDPLANLAKSFGLKGLALPQPEPTDSNPDLTLGRIALKDFSNERVLDRLLMYERRIEHSLYKTTLELQRLHLLRDLAPPNQSEPVRATPHGRPDPPEPNPEPEDRRLAPGPVPGGHHRIKQHPRNEAQTPWGHHHCAKQTQFLQTKKTTATLATAKNYEQKPPRPNSKKQTQSNPNLSRRSPGRSRNKPKTLTAYAIRNTKYARRHTPAPRGRYEIQTQFRHPRLGARR